MIHHSQRKIMNTACFKPGGELILVSKLIGDTPNILSIKRKCSVVFFLF